MPVCLLEGAFVGNFVEESDGADGATDGAGE